MSVIEQWKPNAIKIYYLVVFGGQKFLSFVSDQSFNKKTPQIKNNSIAVHDKIDSVFHGHLKMNNNGKYLKYN